MNVIPRALLNTSADAALKDVDTKLVMALTRAGYSERSYYSIPRGFAIATRMERIQSDGAPVKPPNRWVSDENVHASFSLAGYLKALFTAQPGYYRIIVFAVTDVPFAQGSETPTRDEAEGWVREGTNALPQTIGQIPLNEQTTCTALIYEFKKSTKAEAAKMLVPSPLDSQTHLVKSGLWDSLSH